MPSDQKTGMNFEVAFYTLLTAIIALLGLHIPPLILLSGVFAPVPLAVLVRKKGLKEGTIALMAAAILVFLLAGRQATALVILIQTGPLGLLLGLLFKNYASAGISLVLSILTAIAFTGLSLVFSFFITQKNPLDIGVEIKHTLKQAMDWQVKTGLIDQQELIHMTNKLVDLATSLTPAHIIIWLIISVFLTYLLLRLVLVKSGYTVPPFTPPARWQFPWYTIWGIIAGLILMLIGDSLPLPPAAVAGRNILYITGFFYSILGLCVSIFFLGKWNFPGFFKILLVVLSFLYMPFAMVFLLIVGILDPFINIRRLPGPKEENK